MLSSASFSVLAAIYAASLRQFYSCLFITYISLEFISGNYYGFYPILYRNVSDDQYLPTYGGLGILGGTYLGGVTLNES